MPITEKQREIRKKYIGGSDAPAILNVDKFRNIADVYFSKVQDINADKETPAQKAGNLCEDAVLNWFAEQNDVKIRRNQRRVHKNGIMAANCDALVVDSNEAVEAKTTGLSGPVDLSEWGEPETDEVPERVIVQCQHQMAVIPTLQLVWVPVLIGGLGFRLYKIKRNDPFIKDLEDVELAFWNDHVLKKVPPENEYPSLSLLKRIRRVPKKVVRVESTLVQNWLEAKDLATQAAKHKKEAEKELLTALGDAEAAECDLGQLTYFEQSRKGYTVADTTYRVPRFKKAMEVVL